ncbi:MAG: hypothetical protein F6K41_23225 [Symploca sp. SIO3E6]|nr:hypothetical protein [Caldora sp. SIO3E6]
MQPLTEAQMRRFVCAYLPQQGKQMLKQLGSRLREFGETPLLLWMLCSVFANNSNQIPANLGSVFRRFTEIYDYQLKQGVCTYRESRDWWQDLLQHLAWVMTQGKSKTELMVAIPRQEAKVKLTEFLRGKVDSPDDNARRWLQDLLDYHLIQVDPGSNQIGFCHQLLLEYYTAESLLQRLTSLSDQQLKWDYLNYLKWTEPLALMMELLEDQVQAVRVVKLALEVDWLLGARLAGEVKGKLQEETVSLVVGLQLPRLLKVELAGATKSDEAIPALTSAIEDSNSHVRWNAVNALGKIGSDAAVLALINALEHSDFEVRRMAVEALGKIGSDAAIPALINALEHSDSEVRRMAVEALGEIGSDAAIPALINTLKYSDSFVRRIAVEALGKIGSHAAVTILINALKDSDYDVRWMAVETLGKIGSHAAVTILINTLKDSESIVRWMAAETLGKIGSDAAVPTLINALEDSNSSVRGRAAEALGKIGSDAAVPALINALEDSNSSVCGRAAEALGKIGSDAAVPALMSALKDSNFSVREGAVKALGEIGSHAAVSALIKALLKHFDYDVRSSAAEALGEIGSDASIPALINALEYSEYDVRRRAAEALGEIGSDAAVPALINALEYSEYDVRRKAAEALGKIGSDAAVPALINALLKHFDYDVRRRAAEALGKIGSDTAIPELINSLEDSNYDVRRRAAEALGKIGSDTAIPELIKKLQDNNFVTANSGATLNQVLIALNTIQERCQYYRPTPKLTMPNTLSHNYALLIGVGESAYPQWSLPVTVKDTLALKSLLTDPNLCGYSDDEQHLRLLNDAIATKESILSNLNWLQQQAAADSEATVLVYYSGHGWLDNATGKYYLIPHDVEPFDIPNSALPADTFTEVLQQIPAQRLLVIIDSCHAAGMATATSNVGAKHLGDNSSTKPDVCYPNALPSNAGKKHLKLPGNFLPTALPKELIDKLKQGTGRAVFTSSTGEQQSWIRPDDTMSIYTFHFLEALQGAGNQPGDQVVTVSNLMNYLGKTVPDSAKQLCQAEQTPFFDFATEDFPVALLHGGKGMPQQGWDKVKKEAQERISQIGDISGDNNKINVGDKSGDRNTTISIGTAEKINIGDISS